MENKKIALTDMSLFDNPNTLNTLILCKEYGFLMETEDEIDYFLKYDKDDNTFGFYPKKESHFCKPLYFNPDKFLYSKWKVYKSPTKKQKWYRPKIVLINDRPQIPSLFYESKEQFISNNPKTTILNDEWDEIEI